jgi:hypothetical protein
VATTGEGGRIRDPLEEGEDKSERLDTSRNREESTKESGKDAFGDKSAVRNPDSTSQGDGSTDNEDPSYVGRLGKQQPSSSGTTPLSGEPGDADSRKAPGGVEGEGSTR